MISKVLVLSILGIISAVLLFADVVMLVKIFSSIKKYENQTVEEFGKKIKPYFFSVCLFTVFLAVCMVLILVLNWVGV